MTHLKEGDRAPEFEGVDQNGNPVRLSDFAGKKLIVYFYPKDDTPGCTAEACSLRDSYEELVAKGFAVVGVSTDSQKSHQKFIEKYNLPFTLISDPDRRVIEAFGVWGKKKFMGKEYDGIHRETFVIDENGVILKVFTKVDTKNHAKQILESLEVA
ncbi:thioredoxin-dependent thiol peroxidase [Schleiferia thermophila]|jgi:peroxiredoxin Q/BCP|uniref:thioredoxin-dependent peroxiredoxin n=1 Tax=Schleiferia thermophila TaxID=884107 RepID=A0A369A6R9_9FLAO|nr:thioredoxin-dependent thiol peroxidase [Schleiferia thermophila]KFD39535.1 thiol peroxidase [Schleiferia thermophila str. Yellowstone]PMB33973.1 thioredoxin-dependent thiol peroxidase [Fischerella thermalis CCMEE 5319]RCX05050.1 peroxiredoxin Q/BCP [Schleiferia thermophila]GCD79432.1 peroxiredoxin [Schleiferia thermophila]